MGSNCRRGNRPVPFPKDGDGGGRARPSDGILDDPSGAGGGTGGWWEGSEPSDEGHGFWSPTLTIIPPPFAHSPLLRYMTALCTPLDACVYRVFGQGGFSKTSEPVRDKLRCTTKLVGQNGLERNTRIS